MFYIRLKGQAEEVDLCAAHHQQCEEQRLKHGVIIGIRDKELREHLLNMDSSRPLQDTLAECRKYEANCHSCVGQHRDNARHRRGCYGVAVSGLKHLRSLEMIKYRQHSPHTSTITTRIPAESEEVRPVHEFSEPAALTGHGPVIQLVGFFPDTSAAAMPLSPLMSHRGNFEQTPDHDEAFRAVMEASVLPPVLATPEPTLPAFLQTDASRLYGAGYALLQDRDGGRSRASGSSSVDRVS